MFVFKYLPNYHTSKKSTVKKVDSTLKSRNVNTKKLNDFVKRERKNHLFLIENVLTRFNWQALEIRICLSSSNLLDGTRCDILFGNETFVCCSLYFTIVVRGRGVAMSLFVFRIIESSTNWFIYLRCYIN